MKIIRTISFLIIFALITFAVHAQCKMFAKKYCLDKIKPYSFNGQINTVKLSEGEMAQLFLTFYKDQEYRVYVCSQGNFESVEFKLVDAANNNLLFHNKDHKYTDTWDFLSKSTHQVEIRVFIPEDKSSTMVQSGCVSILVGFKEK